MTVGGGGRGRGREAEGEREEQKGDVEGEGSLRSSAPAGVTVRICCGTCTRGCAHSPLLVELNSTEIRTFLLEVDACTVCKDSNMMRPMTGRGTGRGREGD
jgi:hypothetical protein